MNLTVYCYFPVFFSNLLCINRSSRLLFIEQDPAFLSTRDSLEVNEKTENVVHI